MSKGSGRRPAAVDEQTLTERWDSVFPNSERRQDQQWVEDTRAANLAAADSRSADPALYRWRSARLLEGYRVEKVASMSLSGAFPHRWGAFHDTKPRVDFIATGDARSHEIAPQMVTPTGSQKDLSDGQASDLRDT